MGNSEQADRSTEGNLDKPEEPNGTQPTADAPLSEGVCQVCRDVNPVWYAPNELWNKVMRYPDGREESEAIHFICPNCFIKQAARLGIAPRCWSLMEEA